MLQVFIVDDENIALHRLSGLLGELDKVQIVGTASSASEAVKGIMRMVPDLIFLDIELGGQSGFDVLENIRQQRFYPKVIFVTAYDHYAIKALRQKALDYLLKPVDIDELNQAIESFMQSQGSPDIAAHIDRLTILTDKEREILKELVTGKTSKQLAEILNLSPLTIDTHRRNILSKMKADNTIDLINKLSTS